MCESELNAIVDFLSFAMKISHHISNSMGFFVSYVISKYEQSKDNIDIKNST